MLIDRISPKFGIHSDLSTIQRTRLQILNWVVLISIICCSVFIIINLSLGLTRAVPLLTGCLLSLIATFWLLYKRFYRVAIIYYLSIGLLFVSVISIQAFQNSRFTGTENMLIALFMVSIFISDKWGQRIQSLIIATSLLALKVMRIQYGGYSELQSATFVLINCGVLLILIYALQQAYKGLFLKSLKDTKNGENLLYTLIDNIPLYVGIYDIDQRYSMVNSLYESAFNLKRKEIIGKQLADIIPKENIPKYQPLLERAFKGEIVEFHTKTPMFDGKEIMANGKYVPVFDESGEIKYVTVTLYDVTKIENLVNELKRANQTKNKLFNIVAHDLKSPFGNFEILLNSMEDNILNKEDIPNYISLLKNKFTPLNKTVNDLLEWSVYQLDGISCTKETFDLNPVLDDILKTASFQIENKMIVVDKDIAVPEVFFDRNHMTIILRNFINNAIKFTQQEGRIEIKAERVQDHYLVSVIDTGSGITEAKIEQILSGNTVDSEPGTSGETGSGLGLMFCQELLRKNNGILKIDSKPNGGTNICVKFPIK